MGYAETKACACGDKRIMELHQLKSDLQKLQALEKGYKDKKISMIKKKADHEKSINNNKQKVELLEKDLEHINNNTNDEVMIRLGGKDFTYEQVDEAVMTLGTLQKHDKSGIIGYAFGTPIRFGWINNLMGKEEKTITMGENYSIDLGFKVYPKVMFNDIMDYKNKVEKNIKLAKGNIKILTNELEEIEVSINKPFPKQEELKELKLKVASLEKELSLEECVA